MYYGSGRGNPLSQSMFDPYGMGYGSHPAPTYFEEPEPQPRQRQQKQQQRHQVDNNSLDAYGSIFEQLARMNQPQQRQAPAQRQTQQSQRQPQQRQQPQQPRQQTRQEPQYVNPLEAMFGIRPQAVRPTYQASRTSDSESDARKSSLDEEEVEYQLAKQKERELRERKTQKKTQKIERERQDLLEREIQREEEVRILIEEEREKERLHHEKIRRLEEQAREDHIKNQRLREKLAKEEAKKYEAERAKNSKRSQQEYARQDNNFSDLFGNQFGHGGAPFGFSQQAPHYSPPHPSQGPHQMSPPHPHANQGYPGYGHNQGQRQQQSFFAQPPTHHVHIFYPDASFHPGGSQDGRVHVITNPDIHQDPISPQRIRQREDMKEVIKVVEPTNQP